MNFEVDPAENKVIVYTDGSCLGNPGNGGWCFMYVRENGGNNFIKHGRQTQTTNNKMELSAVIEALDHGKDRYKKFIIHTDSKYVINCGSGVFKRTRNLDLWQKYDQLCKDYNLNVQYIWVKGHSGNKYNQLVDHCAQAEARSLCSLEKT